MTHTAPKATPDEAFPVLDLAAAVQACRDISAQVIAVIDLPPDETFLAMQEDIGLGRLSGLIETRANAEDCPGAKTNLLDLSARCRGLARTIAVPLLVPSHHDLLWRYATGQIDSATTCFVAGWNYSELMEECRFHGWPTPDR